MPCTQQAQAVLPGDVIALHGKWRADKPALMCGQESRSWAAFAAATSQLANGLIKLGVQHGDNVLVLMDNGIAMAETLFGIIRSGGVAAPMNPAISQEALAVLCADCAPRAVFASAGHAARLEKVRANGGLEHVLPGAFIVDGGTPAPDWQGYEPWRHEQPADNPKAGVKPDDPCNIIYSSGTTGVPKGIVHSHKCRMSWASDLGLALRYHEGARTLCSLGLYSNISWAAMLPTMLCGGTVVIMEKFDTGVCLNLIEQERISHTAMVPVQFQRLFADSAFAHTDISSLQAVMACGSPMSADEKCGIAARLGCAFIELYGLTEGVITILPPEDMQDHAQSVGRPLQGSDLVILDAGDVPCPVGEIGQICGYGPLLMSGYHNNSQATRDTGWTDSEGRFWVRTGDLGRLDENGFLHLAGRNKDMIISGGQNIYPVDLETVLAMHPDVQDCAVLGVNSRKWGETPLALVTIRAGARVEGKDLLEWMNTRLGKQQRAAALIIIDELPRNPNGKILKNELRKRYKDIVHD